MELAGEAPDVVVGCVGGGSNFAGSPIPSCASSLREGASPLPRRRAAACPTRRVGVAYDFGDTVGHDAR